MVSCEVSCAVPLQPAPAMFWLEAHILRASSSTVCACTSKRPAIARISCGSVIKRVGMLFSYRGVLRVIELWVEKMLSAGGRARHHLGGDTRAHGAHSAASQCAHQPLRERAGR